MSPAFLKRLAALLVVASLLPLAFLLIETMNWWSSGWMPGLFLTGLVAMSVFLIVLVRESSFLIRGIAWLLAGGMLLPLALLILLIPDAKEVLCGAPAPTRGGWISISHPFCFSIAMTTSTIFAPSAYVCSFFFALCYILFRRDPVHSTPSEGV